MLVDGSTFTATDAVAFGCTVEKKCYFSEDAASEAVVPEFISMASYP